jgi:catalase
VERQHIIDAFVFELSKCDKVETRARMVAGLRNVDDDLARPVADGLGLTELPDPLPAGREPVRDLPPSPALSILANGPASFAGRKVGVLATDGADAGLLKALRPRPGRRRWTWS